MMVPMTSPVADVRPSVADACRSWAEVSSGSECSPPGVWALTALDMSSSSRGGRAVP
jgi:hypothetical protein